MKIHAYNNLRLFPSLYSVSFVKAQEFPYLPCHRTNLLLTSLFLFTGLFEEILNAKSSDKIFQEETEYYVSLAYLMNRQELRAMRLMNKIKSDLNYTYYPLANKLSGIDMKIIELKK